MTGGIEGDLWIGKKIEEIRGLLRLSFPMNHSSVSNWNEMEQIWNYVYNEELKAVPTQVQKYNIEIVYLYH